MSALLENGARPDERSRYGYTPLIEAAREGKVDAVTILLEQDLVFSVKLQL